MRFILVLLTTITCGVSLHAETLDQAVMYAIGNNPTIQAKLMGYYATDAQVGVASSEFYPHLNATFQYGPETANNSSTRALFGGDAHLKRKDGFLSLNQRVFDWGRNYLVWKERIFESYSASAAFYAQAEKIAFEAAEAYLGVIRAREVLEILRDNESVHVTMMDNVTKKVEGGAGRKSELSLAYARLESAKARVTRAESDLDAAVNLYVDIIGKNPDEDMHIPPEFQDFKEDLDEFLFLALINNPVIEATKMNVDAARARLKASKTFMMPTVDVTLTAFDARNIDGIPGRNSFSNALLVLNWDLFNGWRTSSEIRSNKALYLQALWDYEDAQNNVTREVSTAYDVSKRDKLRYQELTQYKENIGDFFRAQEKEFNLNLISLFDLLNSQTEYYNVSIDVVNSRLDVYLDRYRLLQGVGGLVNFICYFSEGL